MTNYSLIFFGVVAATFAQIAAVHAGDSDGDGIPDEIEQQILDTYRPWLYYDHDETVWPCSATWFVKHSSLINNPGCADIPQPILADNPRMVLNSGTWTTGTRSSSLKLNITDDARTGPYANDPALSAYVPIYGHVVPLGDSPDSSLSYPDFNLTFGTGYIAAQFWILFPYNDAHFFDNIFQDDPGDHEGDWAWIDVILQSSDQSPQYVVYHHHGDKQIPPSVVPWAAVEKRDGAAPVVYLEKGTHELWPTAGEREVFYVEPHFGNGQIYRPITVINLGEAGRPMSQASSDAQIDCDIALLFNGEWGDFTGEGAPSIDVTNPSGPVNQTWRAHLRFPIPPSASSVVWVDFSVSYDVCTRPSGFVNFPYPTLAQGVAAVDVGGTISIKSSSTHEALTISKPLTITTVGGIATIGQ